MSTATTSWAFDDPTFYLDDPVPTYHWLHENDPVHWYEEGRFWVVTKHADIRHASSHPGTFSSRRIAVLMDLIRHRRELEAGTATDDDDAPARGVMFMDPPEHAKHRKLVAARLTPKAVDELGEAVRRIAVRLADDLPLDEPVDFMAAVAEPFPVWVFAEILGVPSDDWEQIVRWSTAIAAIGSGDDAPEHMDVVATQVAPYLMALLEERSRDPRDDLLSLLAHGQIDGEPYDLIAQVTMAVTLLAAGSETTQSLLAGMVQSFILNPGEQARVVDQPDLLPAAAEETLRWWTPVRSMGRQAVETVELGRRQIAAGDGLLLLYSAANRDREYWGPTADDFDVTRPDASRHLGFGFGEHFCLGAHLARREVRVMFEEILRRVSRIEPAGEPTPRRSALINGFDRLPVTLVSR